MSKVTNKEKDAALQAYYLDEDRKVSDNIMAILYSDGYIERLTSVNESVVRITNRGKAFYLEGGYAGRERKERTESIRSSLRPIVAAVVGSIVTILIEHVLLPWLRSLL